METMLLAVLNYSGGGHEVLEEIMRVETRDHKVHF